MAIIHASPEPNGILLLTFKGSITDVSDVKQLKADVDLVSKSVEALHKKQGKSIKILIDITNFTADFVTEGVDVLVGLARNDKEFVEKTAIFGASLKVRTIGETIAALSGRSNIQFFETKAQALAWLNKI